MDSMIHVGKVTCTGMKNTPLEGIVAENIDLYLDFDGVTETQKMDLLCDASSIRVKLQNGIWKKLDRDSFKALSNSRYTFKVATLFRGASPEDLLASMFSGLTEAEAIEKMRKMGVKF
jgi:hypothetical protein